MGNSQEKPGVWLRWFGEVGEVSELRGRFDFLLEELISKRAKPIGTKNPLFSNQESQIGELKALAAREIPTCTEEVPSFAREPAAGVTGDDVVLDVGHGVWQSRITKWNTIAMQLRIKLILPLVISLLVIVVFSTVSMTSRASTWVSIATFLLFHSMWLVCALKGQLII